jgi:hypothetical protein
VIIAGLALLIADPPASTPPLVSTQAVAGVLLPAGTPIQLETVDPLDSRTVKQGQRFALRVAEDVLVGSATVIPRGTAAVGEVEAVSGKGMVGKAGRLVLRPLYIELGGERINLTGASTERGTDATAGVAVGSFLISSLGIFITGKSASVPAGSPLPGRVRTDVTLPAVTTQKPTAAPAATATAG